jgi:transposase
MEVLAGPEHLQRWTAEQKLPMIRESFQPGKPVSMVTRQRSVMHEDWAAPQMCPEELR